MIILRTVTSSEAFSDWQFWFALFGLLMTFANTWLTLQTHKEKQEVAEIKNEIQTIINNNVSAKAVASVVLNDEESIRKISTAVSKNISKETTAEMLKMYTEDGHPPSYVLDEKGNKLPVKYFISTRK